MQIVLVSNKFADLIVIKQICSGLSMILCLMDTFLLWIVFIFAFKLFAIILRLQMKSSSAASYIKATFLKITRLLGAISCGEPFILPFSRASLTV